MFKQAGGDKFTVGTSVKDFDLFLKLLNINIDRFSKIHTLELKLTYLTYSWLLAEFICLKRSVDNKSPINRDELELLKTAFTALSSIEHHDKYSATTIGLQQLDIRSRYDKSFAAEGLPFGNQSIFFEGPKKSGVEPGFLYTSRQDLFLAIYQKYPDAQDRWRFILEHDADEISIKNIFKPELPLYQLKGSYTHVEDSGKVIPDEKDLSRAKTIKESRVPKLKLAAYVKLKTQSFIELNTGILLEVLANDVASRFTTAQKQSLHYNEFPNGLINFLAVSQFVKNAKELGPIYGSKTNKKYCASPVLTSLKGIHYLATNTIKDLPAAFPIMTLLGDPDGVGSDAQNKMCQATGIKNYYRFVVIDTGHAFEKDLVKDITPFYTLKGKHKNYSVFFNLRSEIFPGFLKIAKAAGIPLEDHVLKSYGLEFYEEIKAIKPNCDLAIFDDYIRKLEELSLDLHAKDDHISKLNKKCYEYAAAKIAEQKQKYIHSRHQLIQKAGVLSLTKQSLNLIENIEKLLLGKANTTLRSPDGSVLLHHLRVDESKVSWVVDVATDQSSGCHFSLTFNNKLELAKAYATLTQWLPSDKFSKEHIAACFHCDNDNNALSITIPTALLTAIATLFSEDQLMRSFHKEDYKLLLHYSVEQELIHTLEEFKQHSIDLSLTANESNTGYELIINNTSKKEELALFQERFSLVKKGDQLIFPFGISKLKDTYNALVALQFEFDRERLMVKEVQKITLLIKQINELGSGIKLTISKPSLQNVANFTVDLSHANSISANIIKHSSLLLNTSIKLNDFPALEIQLSAFINQYKENLIEIENSLQNLNEFSEIAAMPIGLSQPLFTVHPLSTDFYIIEFNKTLASEYVESIQKHTSIFLQDKKPYVINYEKFAEFKRIIEEINQLQVDKKLSQQQKTSNQVALLNLKFKETLLLTDNCLLVNFDASHLMDSVSVSFSGKRSFMHELPIKPGLFEITTANEMITNTMSYLDRLSQQMSRIKQLSQEISTFLKLPFDQPVLTCFFSNGSINIKPRAFSNNPTIDAFIEKIKNIKPTSFHNILITIQHYQEELIAELSTIPLYYQKLLNHFLQAHLQNLDIVAHIDMMFLEGRLVFTLQTTNSSLQSFFNQIFPIVNTSYFLFKSEDYFEEGITLAIQMYLLMQSTPDVKECIDEEEEAPFDSEATKLISSEEADFENSFEIITKESSSLEKLVENLTSLSQLLKPKSLTSSFLFQATSFFTTRSSLLDIINTFMKNPDPTIKDVKVLQQKLEQEPDQAGEFATLIKESIALCIMQRKELEKPNFTSRIESVG